VVRAYVQWVRGRREEGRKGGREEAGDDDDVLGIGGESAEPVRDDGVAADVVGVDIVGVGVVGYDKEEPGWKFARAGLLGNARADCRHVGFL